MSVFAGVGHANHGTSWASFGLNAGSGAATFTSGFWRFHPQHGGPAGQGGFAVQGTLTDNSGTGDGSYRQGRVEGYGWGGTRWVKNGNRWDNITYYDPAANTVGRGDFRICNHRPILWDQCSSTGWLYHH